MNNTTSLTKMHHEMVALRERAEKAEGELAEAQAELQKLLEQLFGADGWEVNARYVLDRCKHTVRMCEGGGPENLIGSLILTFTKMEGMLDGTVAAIAAPESNRERAARIVARWPKWKSNWRLTRHSPKAESELVEAGGCAPAVIAAPAVPVIEGPAFTVAGDDELNTLLNLSADIARGEANQDSATLWNQTLESVLARLNAAPAALTTLSDDKLISLIYKHFGTEDHPRIVYESGPLYVTKLTYGMRSLADAIIAEASIPQAAPSVPEEWREAVSVAAYHLEQHALEYKHPGQHKLIAGLHALLQSAEGGSSQAQNEVHHD